MKEAIIELIEEGIIGLVDGILSITYFLALIGCPICIILYVAGWRKGKRVTGILFVIHVLAKGLFG
jgi:hypothetical protein